MQVFISSNSLTECAEDLDDNRLKKQIVELCQILTAQYNDLSGQSRNVQIGHLSHPVTQYYHNSAGRNFLLRYGRELCREYRYRFGKEHQGYFTLLGFELLLGQNKERELPPAYIKGRKGKGQQIVTEQVQARYRKLLEEKWLEESPKWTARGKPEWFRR